MEGSGWWKKLANAIISIPVVRRAVMNNSAGPLQPPIWFTSRLQDPLRGLDARSINRKGGIHVVFITLVLLSTNEWGKIRATAQTYWPKEQLDRQMSRNECYRKLLLDGVASIHI
jgi:hypothetical protein